MGEDDDRRTALQPLDVLLEPFKLFVAKRAQPPGLQVDDIDEADEVHAALIEAVPPGSLCALAKSLQVTLAVVFEDIVFAGNVKHRQRQLGQHLLQRVELGRLRQMREITGVQHERGLFWCRLDLRHRRPQRRGDISVRRFVEADMTVADLDESDPAAHAGAVARPAPLRLLDRHAFEHAARQGPHRAGTDPGHALQKPATIKVPFVVLLRHLLQLLVIGRAPPLLPQSGAFIVCNDRAGCGDIPDRSHGAPGNKAP